jgi:hypothetical protein
MTMITRTRVISFVLLAACPAFCQRSHKPAPANSLPDAPEVQKSEAQNSEVQKSEAQNSEAQNSENRIARPISRPFSDTARPYPDTLAAATATHYDPGHFDLDDKADRKPNSVEDKAAQLFRPSPERYHFSTSDSLIGRAKDAATSILLSRDETGDRRFNTSYVLRVLTAAAAHSAYRPYWKRSISQPFSDFGSTVGNDAGMRVFHEFEPGIMQVFKTHEPRFVSKINEHFSHK